MSSAERIAQVNFNKLGENPYPGRGIVIGRTITGELAQIYWVMGRSENSRNRILEETKDVVRTVPYDPNEVEDPSLIIYNAMKTNGSYAHIVSNGHQTDLAMEHCEESGGDHRAVGQALRTTSYEPDAPNYTPRITGYTNATGGNSLIWLTRRFSPNNDEAVHRGFQYNGLEAAALGRCVHTYEGDGYPLPAFKGTPYLVPVGEGAEATAQMFWDVLNPDNKVAIVAKVIKPKLDYEVHIINKLDVNAQ